MRRHLRLNRHFRARLEEDAERRPSRGSENRLKKIISVRIT